MNITFFSNLTSREKTIKYIPQIAEHNVSFLKLDKKDELIRDYSDTDILFIDAMGAVDKDIIDSMPNLKLIMSEGVGYQGVDIEYATSKGIPVCNNKGVNDTAVSEVALLLILSCLKQIITGHQSVYDGRQIEVKRESFGVIRELGECTVGIIGFGDIARQTARLCNAFGARVIYSNRTRYEELESEYNVEYMELDELLKISDFVSLHIAVNDDTIGFVDSSFLAKMRQDAFLINTARGDLVDNEALHDALLNGAIAGAGLDVIAPEPVMADNILLDPAIKDKLILTPHIAGITSRTIERIYKKIWLNIDAIINNKPLINKVN